MRATPWGKVVWWLPTPRYHPFCQLQPLLAIAVMNVAEGLELAPYAMVGHEQKTHRKHFCRVKFVLTNCGRGTGH